MIVTDREVDSKLHTQTIEEHLDKMRNTDLSMMASDDQTQRQSSGKLLHVTHSQDYYNKPEIQITQYPSEPISKEQTQKEEHLKTVSDVLDSQEDKENKTIEQEIYQM